MVKNRQRAGNSNWMRKEAPLGVAILVIIAKMAKLAFFAKMADLAKITNLGHSPLMESGDFDENGKICQKAACDSNWMENVAPWQVAILVEMAILAK